MSFGCQTKLLLNKTVNLRENIYSLKKVSVFPNLFYILATPQWSSSQGTRQTARSCHLAKQLVSVQTHTALSLWQTGINLIGRHFPGSQLCSGNHHRVIHRDPFPLSTQLLHSIHVINQRQNGKTNWLFFFFKIFTTLFASLEPEERLHCHLN